MRVSVLFPMVCLVSLPLLADEPAKTPIMGRFDFKPATKAP